MDISHIIDGDGFLLGIYYGLNEIPEGTHTSTFHGPVVILTARVEALGSRDPKGSLYTVSPKPLASPMAPYVHT